MVENRIDLAQRLLQWGSDINTQDLSRATSLMPAGELGYVELVKWLVKRGANIDLKDHMGETALSKSTRDNRKALFDALLSLPRKHDVNFYYKLFQNPGPYHRATEVHRTTEECSMRSLCGYFVLLWCHPRF